MIPSCTNPIEQIDKGRVITIQFPDATFALEKFELDETILVAYFSFEDTNTKKLEPYENSFNLSVFNITGRVSEVKFIKIEKSNGLSS